MKSNEETLEKKRKTCIFCIAVRYGLVFAAGVIAGILYTNGQIVF